MKSKKIQLYPYWMVVPAALLILVFYILPIGMGFVLSFTNWNIKYPTVEFVGLGNYINIWIPCLDKGKVLLTYKKSASLPQMVSSMLQGQSMEEKQDEYGFIF